MGRNKKHVSASSLTYKQMAIFDYIKRYVQEHNYAPSVRDICKAVNLKSTSSVFTYINDLEKAGLVKKDPLHPRALKVLSKDFLTLTKHTVEIPVIDVMSDEEEDVVVDCFPVRKEMLSSKNTVMIQIDDSKAKYIHDGDYTFVVKQQNYADGDVVITRLNDYVTAIEYRKDMPNEVIVGKITGLVRMDIS